ncbi:hypothetical protein [Sphingobium sp. Z007]|uniref:hypothetical protein n=1 Tax=Sphingobium sp. Z007 TaxID=627495 RepID=UPI000B49EA57|nr:hypothetical protein [Sphingobium sp. Z007]
MPEEAAAPATLRLRNGDDLALARFQHDLSCALRLAPENRVAAQRRAGQARQIALARMRVGIAKAAGLFVQHLIFLVQLDDGRLFLRRLIGLHRDDREDEAQKPEQPAGPLHEAHAVEFGDRVGPKPVHERGYLFKQLTKEHDALIVRRSGRDRLRDPLRLEHHLGGKRRRRLDDPIAGAKGHDVDHPHPLGDRAEAGDARQQLRDHAPIGVTAARRRERSADRRSVHVERPHGLQHGR